MTSRSLDDVLAQAARHQDEARYHNDRATELLAVARDMIPAPYAEGPTVKRRGHIKSLTAWQDWLQDNQPALRRTIADAVGNLSTSATPHVRRWQIHMEDHGDDALPGDTLMTIPAPHAPGTKGRPQVIYFLWSQRYDVLPLFGVGPTRPDPSTTIVPESTQPVNPEPGDNLPALTGVIRPTYNWDGAEDWPQITFDFTTDVGEVHVSRPTMPEDPEEGTPDV